MAKRKRSEASPPAPDSAPVGASTLKRQKKLCTARIAAAQKPLMTALRAGTGLERQKYSRRKKTATAKKDTKGLARLEAEYAVLKGLNIEKVAEQHVRRTIAKVKSIRDHKALPESAREIEKGNPDAATLNVLARLYKIPAVRKEVDATIDDLKAIVAEAGGKSSADKADGVAKKVRVRNDDGDDDMADVSDDDDGVFAAFDARIAAPSSGEEDSDDNGISGDERPPSIGDSASEHDPEDDFNAASDLDAESDADSFAGFSSSSAPRNRLIAPPSDMSDSNSDSDSDSDSASIRIPKPKTKTRTKLPDAKPTTSAFIPALSHGAYFSGSDSEASDLDEAPRKNRRGQRARQKIAEAKFGAAAKHIQKAARNKGWDPKRGAIDDKNAMRSGRGPMQTGENAMPLGGVREKREKKDKKKGERDDKGELHPSWQAAKLAKESKKLVIDLKGTASKKVVFD